MWNVRRLAGACLMACPCWLLGQNLIPNPGFEQYDSIPYFSGQLDFCSQWDDACILEEGFNASSDYLRTDSPENVDYDVSAPTCTPAFAYPRTGQGMAGLIIHYMDPIIQFREYAQAMLIQPLVPGKQYRVGFHITSGASPYEYARASAGFGFLLSTDPAVHIGYDPMPRTPQYAMEEIFFDSTWRAFDVPLVADSAYRYITFGNFFTNGNTPDSLMHVGQPYDMAYLFLDDVSLMKHVDAGNDTTVCSGMPVTLTATGGYSDAYWWEYPPGDTLALDATVTVTPSSDMVIVLHEGTYTDTLLVHPVPWPVVELGADVATCAPSVSLAPTQPGAAYQWSTGSTDATITVAATGTYWLEVGNGHCTVRDSVAVRFDQPTVDLGPDRIACSGDTVRLDAGYPDAMHQWSTGGQDQWLAVGASGVYSVQVDQAGCIDSDTVRVDVDPGLEQAVVPNVMTPNGDRLNDDFSAHLQADTDVEECVLQVWDRWGLEVFRGTMPGEGWDGRTPAGTEAPAGTYFYRLQAEGACGRVERSGALTLLR